MSVELVEIEIYLEKELHWVLDEHDEPDELDEILDEVGIIHDVDEIDIIVIYCDMIGISELVDDEHLYVELMPKIDIEIDENVDDDNEDEVVMLKPDTHGEHDDEILIGLEVDECDIDEL